MGFNWQLADVLEPGLNSHQLSRIECICGGFTSWVNPEHLLAMRHNKARTREGASSFRVLPASIWSVAFRAAINLLGSSRSYLGHGLGHACPEIPY